MVIQMTIKMYGLLNEDTGEILNLTYSESQEWADSQGYIETPIDESGRKPAIGDIYKDGIYSDKVIEPIIPEWNDVRNYRDELLTQSDLLMITDRYSLYTEEQQQELLAYRQALRDIPTAFENPEDVIFPSLSF